jgi:hypothetical protein
MQKWVADGPPKSVPRSWFGLKKAWPPGLRFDDAKTERIIDRTMPPRPAPNAIGCTGALCIDAALAENNEPTTLRRL